MRKTLFALLGLVAIGLWAVPALAYVAPSDPPKAFSPIPLENRAGAINSLAKGGNYQATLSGTLIKQASATTSWFLYPGACNDRAGGTWVAKTSSQADSLNAYAVGTQGGYGRADQSLAEKLFHIVDVATTASQRPAAATFNGSRAIWGGKFDANWVVPVGYPNLTSQILHIDTGVNDPASVTMVMTTSLEQNYDYLYVMGGHSNAEDGMGNNRGDFDQTRANGTSGSGDLLATLTGSIRPIDVPAPLAGGAGTTVIGAGGSGPAKTTVQINLPTGHRALYLLMTADCLFSSEDGLWPFGNGVILDDISTPANPLYAEQTAAGGTDATGGDILVARTIGGLETDGVQIAARVFPGKGELWAIQQGNVFTTNADTCLGPAKSLSSDRFFFGVEVSTGKALPGQFNSIVSCTFPVPAGTADITALWGEYLNLPRSAGYVQYSEYRFHKGGSWSNWENTAAGGGVRTSVINTWTLDGDPLANAVQADSFQVRYNLQCIAAFSVDRVNCDNNTDLGILYDDLFLMVTTGVPAPVFGIFPGSVAQSTFVDGTLYGTNCVAGPPSKRCWPGIRGSDLQTSTNIDIARSAVKDNFNSPLGDSTTMAFVNGLRKNGMGINWRFGFDRTVNGGLTIAVTNGSYNANFDTPRAIYRLYDPATNAWSQWDSTSLDANNVSIAADTVVIDSEYRLNWPPRDKQGGSLVGGFSINGETQYNNLAFLPRGTRVQYYFKAVDITGGGGGGGGTQSSPQFSSDALAREVEDLPTLPGSSIVAPDIIEFNVLPRTYPAGTAGTLLAGRTDTPVLNLDVSYCGWSFQQDPVTAALRGMGVRADRYRMLAALNEGHNIGGHELTGDRPARLSNYFPNVEEYGIKDFLASQYKIIIQNSHLRTNTPFDEQDAELVRSWALEPTGANGGDRCIFISGDDAFNALTNTAAGLPFVKQQLLSNSIFGVANVTSLNPAKKGEWNGAASVPYPTVDDRFAAPASGPGLAAPGSFAYEVDGGCPGPNRFDPLTATGTATAAVTYPVAGGVTDVAGVMNSIAEAVPDHDRIKTMAYGYSIQYVRGTAGAIPRNAANYVRSGMTNRMQILYKFLTGCRASAGSGSVCWPCPTEATVVSNWNGAPGFQMGTYGNLYPIQDFSKATGVELSDAPEAAPRINRIYGNSPNPFNPSTKIQFSAAQAGKVTIRIFNVAGQLVRTLETKVEKAGPASVNWDGKTDRNLTATSGVYFYKATFANGATVRADKSMVLVK